MARSYTKKNLDYWNKVSQPRTLEVQESAFAAVEFTPESCGDSFLGRSELSFASVRSSESSEESTGRRINRAAIKLPNDRFSHIRQLKLPYEYRNDGVDIRDAIELTQKAYANISSFKNAIDLMSEFSNTNVYLKGGNKASRDFFDAWFKRIDVESLKSHFFLEYFRSSNIFMYRVDADWTVEDLMKLRTIYAQENFSGKQIPIRYILLNPYNIVSSNIVSFDDNTFEQILSQAELSRLKNPITEDDKKLFDGLTQEAKDLIKRRSWTRDGIKIKIDPKKLHYTFAKKQPYEPFAIPFGYSVLGDINIKLEMKALDLAIMRTVEMAILHIKHGEKKDQYGGGISQATGNALKQIFTNGTVGRTLVTDYTVSGEFLIPDLKKVLGPEKYTIINQDIREGLQNIIVGEEKYGNTQAKINVFLEKLREARNCFLKFLQSEIKRISKELGFRVYPEAKFEDLSLQDNTELMRIANRLTELGILTPEQLMDVFKRGEFPTSEEIGAAQDAYIKERKAGKWMPLAPVPVVAPPLDPNKPKPVAGGTAKPVGGLAGRPTKASVESLKEVSQAARKLESFIAKKVGADPTEEQKNLIKELCTQIIASEDLSLWEEKAQECIEDSSKMLSLNTKTEVLDLAAQSGLEIFAAALYYHASKYD